MRNVLAEIVQEVEKEVESIYGPRVGRFSSIENNGKIYIDFEGNTGGPVLAKSCVKVSQKDKEKNLFLMFEMNDPAHPVIVGLFEERHAFDVHKHELNVSREKIKNIEIDGERFIFNAKKEIVLQCGKGSITIRKDGKIIIKGSNLLSRASGQNKIKGGSVAIN